MKTNQFNPRLGLVLPCIHMCWSVQPIGVEMTQQSDDDASEPCTNLFLPIISATRRILQPYILLPAYTQRHFFLFTRLQNGLVLGRQHTCCAGCARCSASHAARQYGASRTYHLSLSSCASDIAVARMSNAQEARAARCRREDPARRLSLRPT